MMSFIFPIEWEILSQSLYTGGETSGNIPPLGNAVEDMQVNDDIPRSTHHRRSTWWPTIFTAF